MLVRMGWASQGPFGWLLCVRGALGWAAFAWLASFGCIKHPESGRSCCEGVALVGRCERCWSGAMAGLGQAGTLAPCVAASRGSLWPLLPNVFDVAGLGALRAPYRVAVFS